MSVLASRRLQQGRSVLELIGNTPMLHFKRLAESVMPVQVLAKAEWCNPGGSVKDRAAMSMILDGERTGALTRGKTIVDATSGNTGIAYAMIAAQRGYRVKLALPKNVSEERKQCLLAYGAELVLTDPTEGTDGAQRYVRRLVDADPEKYFYPDQYNNDANWRAHYETTAMEIWHQTQGRVTHFVTGLGTSGTFMGVTRRLKELNPAVVCISMQPDAPLHGLEGLKHMPTTLVPGIYDPSLADDKIAVATEDAQRMVLRLARQEGILVGVSSGANLWAALQVARNLKEGVVVTIFCDSASKYLSESFWQEKDSQAENWP
ncbi:MAG: cysteine synthase family protein [Tepidisphaeraceae bacterium]|jgi:cysteine synthase B